MRDLISVSNDSHLLFLEYHFSTSARDRTIRHLTQYHQISPLSSKPPPPSLPAFVDILTPTPRNTAKPLGTRRSMSGGPIPALPTEVIERIINMVSETTQQYRLREIEERNDSLRACALVARSWVPRSRLHLFRHITLDSDLRTRRFLNSLTLSPALEPYVESLQIGPDQNRGPCGWIYQALSALPSILPHLRVLRFCYLPLLHPTCLVALSRFCSVETLFLRGLFQQSLRETIQLINQFPGLRNLYVWDCSWKLPGRYYSRKQHNLTTLDVHSTFPDCDNSLLEWALASGSTSAVTTFRAPFDDSAPTMNRVLQTCRSTIRQLHVDLYVYGGEWFFVLFFACSSVALGVPPLMHHLSLQHLAFSGHPDKIISLLSHLADFAPSSLIDIYIDPWRGLTTSDLEEIPKDQWKAVDLALCDTRFPHLTSVKFTESSQEPLVNPPALFQRVLPNSYTRGILWLRRDWKGV